jgi:ubiquinone/menaquinone biosynthesis C-methylase UbiE
MQKADTATALSSDPVVEFFDRRAQDYDREYTHQTPGGHALRARRKKVMELFDQPHGKVVDVGCGPGAMAQEILQRGCSFWGVDPSQKMIDICRSRFPASQQIRFLPGDALELPLPDGFFDAALCMGVLDALRDRRQAVREMLRVLKPGGTLIVTFTNIRSPYAWWKNFAFYPAVTAWHQFRASLPGSGAKARGMKAPMPRALYSARAAHDLLRSEGAEVIQTAGYYYNLFISPLDEILPGTALAMTEKLERSAMAKPNWMAAGLIVKARKI